MSIITVEQVSQIAEQSIPALTNRGSLAMQWLDRGTEGLSRQGQITESLELLTEHGQHHSILAVILSIYCDTKYFPDFLWRAFWFWVSRKLNLGYVPSKNK